MCLQNLLIVLLNYFILLNFIFFKFYYLVCLKKAEKMWGKKVYGRVNPTTMMSRSEKKSLPNNHTGKHQLAS